MNLILQIILIAYLFFMVPFYFGILEAAIFLKKHKEMSELMTNGYLLMMAVFCVVAVIGIRSGWFLSHLTLAWVPLTLIVTMTAHIFGLKQMREFVIDMLGFWECKWHMKTDRTKSHFLLLGMLVLMVVVAVFFTRPSSADMTLEIVHTAVTTDTMYVYNAYTGYISGSAMEGHAYSPIEMLYATAACLTEMPETIMLYYVVPVGLLFFFFMALWRVGKQLFENQDHLVPFMLFATTIYWMTTYLDGQSVVTGIFLNSWNGLTLLSCCVMPVTFSLCLEWMKEATVKKGKIENKAEKICMIIMVLLAGQLTDQKGGLYVALMMGLAIAVILVRKGYDYGVTSGRIKKRV